MPVFPTPTGAASDPVYADLASTPTSGYFVVPEGELGQINNALATAADASNPKDLLSASGLKNLVGDTVQSIKQTLDLVTGTQSAWTVVHATSAVQVLSLEGAGLTYYPTQAAAQAQATAQDKNVTPNPGSGGATFGLQLGNTTGLLTRFLKILVGGVLIIAGILKLSGKEDVVMKAGTKLAEGMVLA